MSTLLPKISTASSQVDLNLVEREAVIFLAKSEADVQIKNCPPYIREWIRRERLERESDESSEK
jgi:hypothetical protein